MRGQPFLVGKGPAALALCGRAIWPGRELLALAVSWHFGITCPGPRVVAAQPYIAPGHAWAAVAPGGLPVSRKLPTAPRIGPRVLVEALGGALRSVEQPCGVSSECVGLST